MHGLERTCTFLGMKRTALVTGGTEGIGRAVAIELARKGDRVIIVGRNEERGRAVCGELANVGDARGHQFVRADLSLISETERVARAVVAMTNQLDAVVCCAGILSTIPEWTSEGLERTFALNYLSRYCLTRELLPLLKESSSGRIVLVANAGMYKDTLDLDDLQHHTGKPGLAVSGRTQFANDFLATSLSERLRAEAPNMEVTCVFPGMVRTRVFDNARGLPWFFRIVRPLLSLFQITAEQAAETPAFLARSPLAVGTSGQFYGPRCTKRKVPNRAINPDRRERFMMLSESLVETALHSATAPTIPKRTSTSEQHICN
jgi:NAD(P)-dependent dehydrogenase (short-subunit alcohol dehydrogenase family)